MTMKTYHARIQFTGKHSRLLETKDLPFYSLADREAFLAQVRHLHGDFTLVGAYEDDTYQNAGDAVTALLDAWLAPVR